MSGNIVSALPPVICKNALLVYKDPVFDITQFRIRLVRMQDKRIIDSHKMCLSIDGVTQSRYVTVLIMASRWMKATECEKWNHNGHVPQMFPVLADKWYLDWMHKVKQRWPLMNQVADKDITGLLKDISGTEINVVQDVVNDKVWGTTEAAETSHKPLVESSMHLKHKAILYPTADAQIRCDEAIEDIEEELGEEEHTARPSVTVRLGKKCRYIK